MTNTFLDISASSAKLALSMVLSRNKALNNF